MAYLYKEYKDITENFDHIWYEFDFYDEDVQSFQNMCVYKHIMNDPNSSYFIKNLVQLMYPLPQMVSWGDYESIENFLSSNREINEKISKCLNIDTRFDIFKLIVDNKDKFKYKDYNNISPVILYNFKKYKYIENLLDKEDKKKVLDYIIKYNSDNNFDEQIEYMSKIKF